jgi:hypothetical protein
MGAQLAEAGRAARKHRRMSGYVRAFDTHPTAE